MMTPFLFFSGAFALFQLAVKWLKPGDDETADKVSDIAEATLLDPETKKALNGRGKLILPDGRVYEGTFRDGHRFEPQNSETFSFPNGDCLRGKYIDGLFTGTGKITLPSGDVYEGDFINGKFTGQGKVTYSQGIVYEGNFVNWKPFGAGIVIFQNGEVLNGTFNNGIQDGEGRLTFEDGREIDIQVVDGVVQH